jgi:hypothetical protein
MATVRTPRPGLRRTRLPWILGLAAAAVLALVVTLPRLLARRAPAPPAGPAFSPGNAVVLDEAAKFCETKPADSLRLAETVLAEEPGNPRAWALKLACLYHLNRPVDFGEAVQSVEDRGVRPEDLLAVKAYRAVLEQDRERRRLPEDLRRRLLDPGGTQEAGK